MRLCWLSPLLLVAACAADDRAPPVSTASQGGSTANAGRGGATEPTRGGATTTGGASTGGKSTSGGATDAGGGAEAGGEGGEGGELVVRPPPPPVCETSAVWGGAQRLPISGSGDDVLGGVTPDELSVVWLADGELRVADRGTPSGAFEAPQVIDAGPDYFAGATLSPDGLTLVGVRRDGTGFGFSVRAARGAGFEPLLDEAPFAALYDAPAARLSDGPFADPVFDPSGLHLYYSALDAGADGVTTIHDSQSFGDEWPWGLSVPGALLNAGAGAFRRPSGLASDLRALFYWDEVTDEARMATRARPDAAFDASVSLGDRRYATPNISCDRLYYSARGNAGLDLFVATKQ